MKEVTIMLQKTMSFILGCVLAFSHVAGLMHAAASIDQSPPCDEHRVSIAANHTLYAIWVLDGPAPINIDFDQVISNIMEVKSL